MGRRVVYLAVAALLAMIGLFALSWSDARLAFLTLGATVGAGAWWLTRSIPPQPVSARELRWWSIIALVLAFVVAFAVPTTQVFCECPGPAACGCAALDHHVSLRVAIAAAGTLLALGLAMGARWRSSRLDPVHEQFR